MEHIAIDLGGRKSQICVRAEDGTIVLEARKDTCLLGSFLRKRPPSRVVLETCAEAFHVADQALAAGHEVRVVPATLVRQLGVGARRTKTDRRDARILSEVSCRIDLPSVHIPSEKSRRYKRMSSAREVLLRSRTQLVNNVRGWLRTIGVRIRRGAMATFVARVREACEVAEEMEGVLEMIEHATEQIKKANKQIEEAAREDAVCRRLMSVPGVGPVTAVRYVGALDEIERFGNAKAVESYLGLVPGIHASSDREHRLSLTKAGVPTVRRVLVQGAWAALRCRPGDPMVEWAMRIANRRGKFIAVVALARKMAGILYAIWRDGTTYDPRRGAARREREGALYAAAA